MSATVHTQWDPGHDDDTVLVLSDDQYHKAAQAALRELGLTYPELEEQARTGSFSSAQAQALWVVIGGHPSAQ
jgi:hypothetical protein